MPSCGQDLIFAYSVPAQERTSSYGSKDQLNRKEFCEEFDIPYRTVSDWELEKRHAPEYVLRLLEYYIRNEKLNKN